MSTTSTPASMRTPPPGYAWSRFGLPEYTDWMDETRAAKTSAHLGDWSFLWQHRIQGPDALRLISEHTVNSTARFPVGSSKHAIHTDGLGRVIHEGVLTRFGEEEFVVHGRGGFWLRHRLEAGGYDARIVAEDSFNFQVNGPAAPRILHDLDPRDGLLEAGWMHVVPIEVAGHSIHALRQGMSGEPGFELQGPAELGPEVRAAVLAAGERYGIRQMGGRIAPINHLEAGYPTIATDYIPAIFEPDTADYLDFFLGSMPAFAKPAYLAGSFEGEVISDYYRSPVELGWAGNVNGDHDFLGRDALLTEKAAPRRVLRTLVWDADDVGDVLTSILTEEPHYTFMELPRDQRGYMWADRVEDASGRPIGVATSRGFSYTLRQTLSFAVLDVDAAELGSAVTVVWGNPDDPQKPIRATVAPVPYKRDRARGDLRAMV